MFQRKVFVGKCAAVNANDAGAITLKSEADGTHSMVAVPHAYGMQPKLGSTMLTHVDKIAALYHKVFDDTMEVGTLEAERYAIFAMLAGTELPKVFAGFWHNICIKL